jgi:hypothetical protein
VEDQTPGSCHTAADANGNIPINPGNRLSDVPARQGKLKLTYRATDQWTIGGILIAQSGQIVSATRPIWRRSCPGSSRST